MGFKQGCLKPALFGCLGLIGLVVIILAVTSAIALRGIRSEQVEDRALVADGAVESRPGRVELDLAHGEFVITPGEPGSGVLVKARFDQNRYELIDQIEVLPDSTWVYRVSYRSNISGLEALMRAVLGGSKDSRVEVFLPPDVPIDLDLKIGQGGGEAELGGLWLTDVAIQYKQGGLELSISEPLREPLGSMTITGSQGGFAANGLGHASPSVLVVDCNMGGAQVDLSGQWLNSSDVRLGIRMGGMAVLVPRELTVEGVAIVGGPEALSDRDAEMPAPVLRMSVTQRMGEIEVIRQ